MFLRPESGDKEFEGTPKEDIPTVDNLSGVVKRIYVKIREQLDDPSHPLIRIIKDFQFCFMRDMKDKLREINTLHDDNEYFRQNTKTSLVRAKAGTS